MHPPLICFAIIYEGEGKVRTANGKLLDFCGADKLSRIKVFASLFSKSDCPSKGAQPLVASAGAKHSRRLICEANTFLFAPAVPKRTEKIFSTFPFVFYMRTLFPFFLAKLPQKEPKTASYGALPRTPPPFEKGGRKLSSCGRNPLLGNLSILNS